MTTDGSISAKERKGRDVSAMCADVAVAGVQSERHLCEVVAYLERCGVRRVLDVATRSGHYSTRLLLAGFDVVSTDRDMNLQDDASDFADQHGQTLTFVPVEWPFLRRDVGGGYDAVLSMGNALAHVFKAPERRRMMAEFQSVLDDNGVLLVEHRNFDLILNKRSKPSCPVYETSNGAKQYVDFVDEGLVRMRCLFQDRLQVFLNVFPLQKERVRQMLFDVGFQQVDTLERRVCESEHRPPDFWLHVARKT